MSKHTKDRKSDRGDMRVSRLSAKSETNESPGLGQGWEKHHWYGCSHRSREDLET